MINYKNMDLLHAVVTKHGQKHLKNFKFKIF
jgi:hypothetical protein